MVGNSTHLIQRNRLSDSAVLTSFVAGTEYLVAGLSDSLVHIFTSSGDPFRTLPRLDDDETSISALAIEDDHLIIGRTSGMIESWALKDNIRQKPLQAHKSSITALITRGREDLISSSRDGTIKIWNALTWECKYTLRGHNDIVIAIVAHDCFLVSGSYDGTCKLWDLDSGALLSTLTGVSGKITCLAFNGRNIVAGDVIGKLQIWSTEEVEFECAVEHGHTSIITQVCIEKERIITAGADGMLKSWSGNQLNELWEAKVHPNAVNSMDVRNGMIVTGGSNDVVRLWRLEDGALMREMGVRSAAVWKVGFLADGNIFHTYWDEGAVLDILGLSNDDSQASGAFL